MTRTVALTGMTGFIGRHIAENLLSRGFAVRALTRKPDTGTVNNVTWIKGSLEHPDALAELVDGADSVVHCAGVVRGHKESIFAEGNVNGSLRLMQAAEESRGCRRFLFISSLAARHPELSWYAKSKSVAEQQLTTMATQTSLGIFRPTAVYGPGDKELKPVLTWLLRGVLPCLGSPESRLSFIHVSDLAQAVGQWLASAPQPTRPCELCDGVDGGYNWQRLQEIGARVRQGPVRLVGVPLPVLKLLADTSVFFAHLTRREPMLTRSKIHELTHHDWSASNKVCTEQITWRPEISLEHALRERLF